MRSVLMTAALAMAIGHSSVAAAASEPKVSGPYAHDNLTIFLIHADAAAADDVAAGQYVTLDEALADKLAMVYETGDVNELAVENLSKDRTLFIQAGDIVKGGRQDRVLSVDLVLPPGSGRTPITAFCVEHGRWTRRSNESAGSFDSADKSLAGKDLKLAAKAARSQQDVWNAVAKTQATLAASLGEDVAAAESPTSLQLTLENKKLEAAIADHVAALTTLADRHGDAIGYVYAVDGRISGGDVYPSPTLFRKLWPKLLAADATEAVAQRAAAAPDRVLTIDDVVAFLVAADGAASTAEQLPAGVTLISRSSDDVAAFETRTAASDSWVHRSYIVK